MKCNYRNKFAIIGFVLSLFGIFTIGITSIVGLVYCILGLLKSKKIVEGKKLSIIGLINCIFILIIISIIIFPSMIIKYKILSYEEKLHNKDFEIVSFKLGHNRFFATDTETDDELVLKYKNYEFSVGHVHNKGYTNKTICDNFVYIQEKDNIEKDIQVGLSNYNFDSFVKVGDDNTSAKITYEGTCMFDYTGTKGKYQGILNMNPYIAIYIFTNGKVYEEYDNNTKIVLNKIKESLNNSLGLVPEYMDIYFIDKNVCYNKQLSENCDSYSRASLWYDNKKFMYNDEEIEIEF